MYRIPAELAHQYTRVTVRWFSALTMQEYLDRYPMAYAPQAVQYELLSSNITLSETTCLKSCEFVISTIWGMLYYQTITGLCSEMIE